MALLLSYRRGKKPHADNPDISICISWPSHIDSEEQVCY